MEGVIKSLPILQDGTRRLVRNGRGTSFWNDVWFGDTAMLNLATMRIPESEIGRTVASYWVTNQGWDWSKLIAFLLADVLNELAATIIHEEQNAKDSLGWRNEVFGNFTVSSAYDIADGFSTPIDAAKWNAIWKLKLPNRIKTFQWLVRHGKIMTNANLTELGRALPQTTNVGAVQVKLKILTMLKDSAHKRMRFGERFSQDSILVNLLHPL